MPSDAEDKPQTEETHALVAKDGRVTGSIAIRVAPGSSHEARAKLIDDTLAEPLAEAATALGTVLAAAPSRFTRERPGRDPQGRTILDVAGRAEGDRLVPAVSRASKNMRS